MNLSPDITRDTSCASDYEFEERRSYSSRVNVYFNNGVIGLTFFMTHLATKKMLQNNIFSKTTRSLLFCCMLYYVLHDIYFAGVMNWSLLRSVVYSDDRCHVMFVGSECFFLYIVGVFARILLLTSQVAVTAERLIVTIFPNSDLINTATVNMMTIILSVIGTSMIKPPGPSEFNSPNCFQQMFVGMKTFKSLLIFMLLFVAFCFPVNCIVMIKHRIVFFHRFKTNIGYTLNSRFADKQKMYASTIVSVISFFQTLIYSVYIAALYFILKYYTTDEGMFYGSNLILWFYTFPFAGLALPTSIVLSYSILTYKRKNKVGVMKVNNYTSQDAYFKNLKSQWNQDGSRLSIT
ncbi:hypothetical protein CAEBREN_13110 [Caenorhabditis brenneri]|uniref:G-protein coupled receptors family 1 profile domain-containing protein n=1 Tax=Caenorhabditis brenneri TaxID=135651 RepID=G0MN90_CAEBE|nr:hypothetical protein CAEBREN_13110 [Caenorhabditis brenneri]